MNKKRQSNFELCRIVAMFMIIAHHYCVHGVFDFWHVTTTLTSYINCVLLSIIATTGKLGVNLFVLISGYFLISSNFNLTHFLKVYFKTLVYSLLILITAYFLGEQISSQIVKLSIAPFGKNAYWFISAYLMLYILAPFLNRFILTTKKNMLNNFMFITTILWVIIPTFTSNNYAFSNLIWFIYLYFIGASIRLKTFARIFNNKLLFKNLSFYSLIFLLAYSFITCCRTEINLWKTIKFAEMNSIFIVVISIYLFHYFKDLKLNYNKLINWVSISVLGIYLFHDNCIFRPILWQKIVHPSIFVYKYYMIFYLIFIVLSIFIIGTLLDKIIMLIFDKHINNIVTALQKINYLKLKIYCKNFIKFFSKN